MENVNSDIYNPAKVSYETDESSEFRDNVNDRLYNSSPASQLFLYSTQTPTKIKELCDKFQLAPTQSMFLTCIIRDVAIAITYYGDIVKEIQDKLDVPEVKARQIAQAVTELYDFALEEIKKLQVATFPDRISKSTAKPPIKETPDDKNVVDLRKKP